MGLFDSPTHLLIVLVVLVLLFGSAKLPRLAKSLGESMRIFKGEAQKLQSDDKQQPQAAVQQQQQPFTQQELPQQPPVASQPPVQNQAPQAAPVPGSQHTNQTG
jgi:sec-independent protein translocase protein TatA